MIYFLNGLAFSMILYIVAVGINISFGILGIINFAHGILFLFGAYLTYTIIQTGGNFWIALIFAPLIVAFLGWAIEYFFIRHLYNRHHTYTILLTFAITLASYDLIKMIWGSSVKTVSPPHIFSGAISILGNMFPLISIFIIGAGLLVVLAVWFIFQKTRLGKIFRAVALDREIANALGFNVNRTFSLAFMLSAFMAGLGGALGSLKISFAPGVDAEFLIYSFAIAVIGGVGSFRGTLLASLIVGEMHVLGGIFFPELAMALIFFLLVVFLSTYPRGLFGREIQQVHIPIAPYVGDFDWNKISWLKNISPQNINRLQVLIIMSIFIIAPFLLTKYWTILLAEIMIFGLFSISFNILFGYTGLLSFGQAAIFAAGAYGISLILIKLSAPWWMAFGLALGISLIIALVMGLLSIHRTEIYFAMLTMAFAQLFYSIIYKWKDFTGGADGLTGIPHPRLQLFDWQILIKSPMAQYYFIFLIVGLSYFVLRTIMKSPFGQMLIAIRENPSQAELMGLDTRKYKLLSFLIAGFFTGVSGALYAPFAGTIDTLMAHWSKSGEPVFMTLMGGTGSLFGPFIGTFCYYSLQSFISSKTEYWMLILGLILIAIVMVFPLGIIGYLKMIFLRIGENRNRITEVSLMPSKINKNEKYKRYNDEHSESH